MDENMVIIRGPKTFYFYLPEDVNKNLKHETEFIIKSNESLSENKIKRKNEQILSKYKRRNNIHKHRKKQDK